MAPLTRPAPASPKKHFRFWPPVLGGSQKKDPGQFLSFNKAIYPFNETPPRMQPKYQDSLSLFQNAPYGINCFIPTGALNSIAK